MHWRHFNALAAVCFAIIVTTVNAEDAAAPTDSNARSSLAMLVSVSFLISMTVVFQHIEEWLKELVAGSRIVVMVETALGELTVAPAPSARSPAPHPAQEPRHSTEPLFPDTAWVSRTGGGTGLAAASAPGANANLMLSGARVSDVLRLPHRTD